MTSIWTVRRSTVDSKLAGLSGGIGQAWGVDPVLVRVAFVLLALCGGIGVVLYGAGWFLLPRQGEDHSHAEEMLDGKLRTWPRELWIALVVVASTVSYGLVSGYTPIGFGPVIILALIWYFGYYKNRSPRSDEPPFSSTQGTQQVSSPPSEFHYPGPPTPFTEAADAWRLRIQQGGEPQHTQPAQPLPVHRPVPRLQDPPPVEPTPFLAHPDPVGLYAPEESATPAPASGLVKRADRTSARRLRLVGVLVLGLTMGGLSVAAAAGVTVTVLSYLAAALLVVGLTLVAATWFGRARGILPVGIVLLLAVLVTALSVPVTSQEWEATDRSYASLADLPPAGDSLTAGHLRVDLSDLAVSRDVTYTAHVGLGSLEVVPPANVNVRVEYSLDAGAYTDRDHTFASGLNKEGVDEPAIADPSRPTLTLDLSVGRGMVTVVR